MPGAFSFTLHCVLHYNSWWEGFCRCWECKYNCKDAKFYNWISVWVQQTENGAWEGQNATHTGLHVTHKNTQTLDRHSITHQGDLFLHAIVAGQKRQPVRRGEERPNQNTQRSLCNSVHRWNFICKIVWHQNHQETLAFGAVRSFSAWQQAHFSFAVCEPPLYNYGKTNWEIGLLWWLMFWHRQISWTPDILRSRSKSWSYSKWHWN